MNSKTFLGVERKGSFAKTAYTELNEKVERVSYLMNFFLVKLTVFVVFLSAIILTEINYFVYGLDDEAFILPFTEM